MHGALIKKTMLKFSLIYVLSMVYLILRILFYLNEVGSQLTMLLLLLIESLRIIPYEVT